jgi:hypothetical protein
MVLDDIPVKLYSDSAHASSGLPEWEDERWAAFTQLIELRWFSRIWVVQEVVLSPKDPFIIYGKHLYHLQRLEWAAAWMRRNGYIRLPQIPTQIHNIDTISILRGLLTKWPLDALMSITQIKFHATDQRDKVYAQAVIRPCSDCSPSTQVKAAAAHVRRLKGKQQRQKSSMTIVVISVINCTGTGFQSACLRIDTNMLATSRTSLAS